MDPRPRFVVDASGTCTDASAAGGGGHPPRVWGRAAATSVFRGAGWAGTLLVLFSLYSLFGTGLVTQRSQGDLRGRFEERLATRTAAAPSGASRSAAGLDLVPPRPPQGEAVAILKVPKIGVEHAVVEGTRFGDLTKGPGHYVDTPLPGEPGNAGIAGHRTTYGAPFGRLDELAPGDVILVTTLAGAHRFEVTASWVVKPFERSVLAPTEEPAITLTTCHPAFRRTHRLIVRAVLRPATPVPDGLDQLVAPPAVPSPAPVVPVALVASAGPAASSTTGSPWRVGAGGLAAAAAWTALQLLARRRRVVAWLAFGGPLVASLLFLFDALNRALGTAI